MRQVFVMAIVAAIIVAVGGCIVEIYQPAPQPDLAQQVADVLGQLLDKWQ